jgi:hypothetical protein
MGTRMPSPHFSQWRAKTAAGRVAGPHVYQEELIAAVALIAEVFEGDDLSQIILPRDFTIEEIDRFHEFDRASKRIGRFL